MRIKVLEKVEGSLPEIIEKGEWIDLKLSEDVVLKGPQATMLHRKNRNKEDVEEERTRDVIFFSKLLPLGVCMEMPDGFEGYLLPRSSTFKKYGIIQTNSMGVIDTSYKSDEDEWKMPVIATRKVVIPKGTRIAQFRIQLSQKATLWQKLKWLLSSSVKIEKVSSLGNPVRSGFGSTGEK